MTRPKWFVFCVGVVFACCGLWGCNDNSTSSGPSPLEGPIGWMSVWAQDSNLEPLPTPEDTNPAFPNPISLRDITIAFRNIAFYNSNGDQLPVKIDSNNPPIGLLGPVTQPNVPDAGAPGVLKVFQSFPLPAGDYSAFQADLQIRNIKIVVQTSTTAYTVWTCTLPTEQQTISIPRMTITGSALAVGPTSSPSIVVDIPVTAWDWCRSNNGVGGLTVGAITVAPKS